VALKLDRVWRRFKMKQGVACRFHDLRHTHATQLLKAGVQPKVVSERLGHASIGITLDTYSHVMPGMQEEAAEKIDAGPRAALAGQGPGFRRLLTVGRSLHMQKTNETQPAHRRRRILRYAPARKRARSAAETST
jgi:hypothetical protein